MAISGYRLRFRFVEGPLERVWEVGVQACEAGA